MIMLETGYLTKENGTWKHFYYLKDHLGNNRRVVNQSGAIVQSLQYEPFGMTFADGINAGWQPYKFGGKEEETDCRLNWYDFESRLYVPDLGRFMQPDPMAEKYYSISPYAYCLNNPVRFIDPTGCDTVPVNEVWDYDQINFSSDGTGIHDTENYTTVQNDAGEMFNLHPITSGENEGNYIAIQQYGKDADGYDIYEYKYVVGKDKVEEFKNGKTKACGIKQSIVRYAMNNGVDGRKSAWENIANGWFNIVTDPASWIPSPLDMTNYLPKSFYQTSKGASWNQFRTQTKGQYTTKNYGTYQNALKARSADYKKQK